jgi:hypothetical protein
MKYYNDFHIAKGFSYVFFFFFIYLDGLGSMACALNYYNSEI